MSLDVYLNTSQCPECGRHDEPFNRNITHNLGRMAEAAGLYKAIWRPEELGINTAGALIAILRDGLKLLQDDPPIFRCFNPSNGWGTYEDLVTFVGEYLQACKENPDAMVTVSR